MGKLSMCRICLVENVRMYEVVNKNLQELYEKLTDVPFVTEDSRPILACSFCCAKLKQCFRLMRKCLEAEELFTQMMNEDCELNTSTNHDPLEFCSGLITCEVVHISINDACQTESVAVKEELPAVYVIQDDIIEPKEEYQSDELEAENQDNTGLGIEDMLPHTYDSDSESDVPLTKIKIEVEEHDVEKRRAEETNRTIVTKKEKLDTRRLKQEDTITAELENNEQSNLKLMETTQKPDQRNLYQVEDFRQDKSKNIIEKKHKIDSKHNFGNYKHLTEQVGTHTGERLFKCDVCQRSFSRKQYLVQHIRTHTGEQPYKCDVCPSGFSNKGHLIDHIRIHTAERPFKCDVCLRDFSRKGHLIEHIRIHTGEKPYKCDVCPRSFSSKYSFISHNRIHTGEKPYKCDLCQLSFTRNGELKRHILKHSSEKRYTCDICQRSFSRNNDLRNHVRTHTGETLFKCDVCPRSFTFKVKLTRHYKEHTDKKPFKCDICQISFTRKRTFSYHIRSHTGEKP